MNCILLDDEKPALELLEDNVKQIPFLQIIASTRDPMTALEAIKNNQIDLIFLDVQMPGLNGLDLIRSIKMSPLFILITAHEEHALEGFNLDVVDYLVKPVPFPRFLKAVQKAQELHSLRESRGKLLIPENDYVFVNANYSLVKIKIQDIAFIEGLKDYIKINLTDGKAVVTRMGLKAIEGRLHSGRFMRVHKSYIIALEKIESIQKTQLVISGQEVPIGDGYRNPLQAYVNSRNL